MRNSTLPPSQLTSLIILDCPKVVGVTLTQSRSSIFIFNASVVNHTGPTGYAVVRSLMPDAIATLIKALVATRLDYCSSLCAGHSMLASQVGGCGVCTGFCALPRASLDASLILIFSPVIIMSFPTYEAKSLALALRNRNIPRLFFTIRHVEK